MKFVWDPLKKEKVAKEHHIDFERIEDVFRDPFAVEFIDEPHSDDEIRFG
jgi:uncharacterized DUF497 family protein